jgi:hypothetical protein
MTPASRPDGSPLPSYLTIIKVWANLDGVNAHIDDTPTVDAILKYAARRDVARQFLRMLTRPWRL